MPEEFRIEPKEKYGEHMIGLIVGGIFFLSYIWLNPRSSNSIESNIGMSILIGAFIALNFFLSHPPGTAELLVFRKDTIEIAKPASKKSRTLEYHEYPTSDLVKVVWIPHKRGLKDFIKSTYVYEFTFKGDKKVVVQLPKLEETLDQIFEEFGIEHEKIDPFDGSKLEYHIRQ